MDDLGGKNPPSFGNLHMETPLPRLGTLPTFWWWRHGRSEANVKNMAFQVWIWDTRNTVNKQQEYARRRFLSGRHCFFGCHFHFSLKPVWCFSTGTWRQMLHTFNRLWRSGVKARNHRLKVMIVGIPFVLRWWWSRCDMCIFLPLLHKLSFF